MNFLINYYIMKRIFFIIAIFAAFFSASASDFGLKKIFTEPWPLNLNNNEKVYVVKCINALDSGYLVTTQDDNLFFEEAPKLYCNQVIIVDLDTLQCETLYRNSTVNMIIILIVSVSVIVFVLLMIALKLIKEP